jgi:hypothetical protein
MRGGAMAERQRHAWTAILATRLNRATEQPGTDALDHVLLRIALARESTLRAAYPEGHPLLDALDEYRRLHANGSQNEADARTPDTWTNP